MELVEKVSAVHHVGGLVATSAEEFKVEDCIVEVNTEVGAFLETQFFDGYVAALLDGFLKEERFVDFVEVQGAQTDREHEGVVLV